MAQAQFPPQEPGRRSLQWLLDKSPLCPPQGSALSVAEHRRYGRHAPRKQDILTTLLNYPPSLLKSPIQELADHGVRDTAVLTVV